MDGRPKLLLLRIEHWPTPPDQSTENRRLQRASTKLLILLRELKKDTQQAKGRCRWSVGTADLLHLLAIQLAMLCWSMTTDYVDVEGDVRIVSYVVGTHGGQGSS